MGDAQIGRNVAQRVVGTQRQRVLVDGVAAHVASRAARQGARERVVVHNRSGADLVAERRIGGTINLGLGICGDGDRARGDDKAVDPGQAVVGRASRRSAGEGGREQIGRAIAIGPNRLELRCRRAPGET